MALKTNVFECKVGTVGPRKMYVSKVLNLIARVLDFGTPEFILKGQRGGNSYGIIKNEKRNDRIGEEKLGGG